MKTIKIRIKDNKVKPYIVDKVYEYRHFENMYIILLHQDYNQKLNDFKVLTDYKVMRAVLTDNNGGKVREKAEYIKEKYKDHSLMKDIIESSKNLKIHNLVEIMKRVKSQYKGFFTKNKRGDVSARPPKTKKLSKMHSYTIPLDSHKSFSLKNENKAGINLDKKMIYTHMNFVEVGKLTGGIDNIESINLNFSNKDIYFLITHNKKTSISNNPKEIKSCGIDLGIENLITLYINDDKSNSLIIDGRPYKTYNSNFNRITGKLNTDISNLINKKNPEEREKNQYLCNFRSFLYEKRNRYFETEFNKISKRVVEYLIKNEVTNLTLSNNLAELKNNGDCKLRKSVKQSFIQIPFIKLLKMIKYKSEIRGITVNYVDEAYTSKTSSISGDIKEIQVLSKDKKLSTDDFCGSRVKRGLFLDNKVKKVVNADCNAGFNICKLNPAYKDINKKGESWFKLCNPKKFKSDHELCKFLHNNEFG
jgi:IS605 OrfB family transposase